MSIIKDFFFYNKQDRFKELSKTFLNAIFRNSEMRVPDKMEAINPYYSEYPQFCASLLYGDECCFKRELKKVSAAIVS